MGGAKMIKACRKSISPAKRSQPSSGAGVDNRFMAINQAVFEISTCEGTGAAMPLAAHAFCTFSSVSK